jgi:hypothetical protein
MDQGWGRLRGPPLMRWMNVLHNFVASRYDRKGSIGGGALKSCTRGQRKYSNEEERVILSEET